MKKILFLFLMFFAIKTYALGMPLIHTVVPDCVSIDNETYTIPVKIYSLNDGIITKGYDTYTLERIYNINGIEFEIKNFDSIFDGFTGTQYDDGYYSIEAYSDKDLLTYKNQIIASFDIVFKAPTDYIPSISFDGANVSIGGSAYCKLINEFNTKNDVEDVSNNLLDSPVYDYGMIIISSVLFILLIFTLYKK